MSPDQSEKTEQPTRKRLRDARKKGQVAQSKEIASTALILSFFLYIAMTWQAQIDRLTAMILLPSQYAGQRFSDALPALIDAFVTELVEISLPFIIIAIVVSVSATLLQVGWVFSAEPIKPDIAKIDPVAGMKRIFGVRNLVELLKSLVKLCALGIVLFVVIRDHLEDLGNLLYSDLSGLLGVIARLCFDLGVYLAPVLIVVAAIDFFWQKSQFVKDQMMTKDERKREFKETEGDPLIKGARRQQQRKLAQEDIGERIRTGTVVVVDGQKAAVVLWYEKDTTPLPKVTVLTRGLATKKLLKLAEHAGKPIVENRAVAQALVESVQTNDFIPADLIDDIAAILRDATG